MSAASPDRAMQFAFDAADHAAIIAMLHAETGIVVAPSKTQLVYGRLAPRIRAAGLNSFAAYIGLIKTDREERTAALDALTTNHTSFFREAHHFEHFATEVWPGLAARLAERGRVRLWSSACSSGEEPYSLAMVALGRDRAAGAQMARNDLRILATDISGTILTEARAARYPLEIAKSVPPELRGTWLNRCDDQVEIAPEPRSLVSFRPLNLLDTWPMRGKFDAIFCRNVMIYFDEATKARLQTRFAEQLVPGGYLYLGHSERLASVVMDTFTCVGRTIFRKVAP